MSTTLVHIGVRTTNLKKSIRFWRDALGLNVSSTKNGCYDLTDGYHNFRVFQHNGPERPEHRWNVRLSSHRCARSGFARSSKAV